MLKLKDLVKSNRRKDWAALKSKHAKALAAKKIDFESKLGAQIDKYQATLSPVEKAYAQQQVTTALVDKVVAAARPLRSIAESYRAKLKGAGDPLEKEMVAFLKSVEAECDDWESAHDLVAKESIAGRNSPAQVKAVRNAYGELDALGQQLINLCRSLPDAAARAKKIPGEAKYRVYQGLSKKAVPEKDWKRELGADMSLMGSHITTLGALAKTADAAVKRLVAGCVDFDERSDYEALKRLANSFASSSAIKDFKARSALLDQWMKGVIEKRDYEKGPMKIAGADMAPLRRAAINAAEAGKGLVDPALASIRALP